MATSDNSPMNGPNPKAERAGTTQTKNVALPGGIAASIFVTWDATGGAIVSHGTTFSAGTTWATLTAVQAQKLRSFFAQMGVNYQADATDPAV